MTRRIVSADIGGTHARFAIATGAAGRVTGLGDPITMNTTDHASFQLAWQHFCIQHPGDEPDAISIAFAGPGMVWPWADRIASGNEMTSIAHGLALLGEAPDLHDWIAQD